jgi:hypothetical protein
MGSTSTPTKSLVSLRTLAGAGAVALLGVAVLVLFLWMIDPAAAREVKAA